MCAPHSALPAVPPLALILAGLTPVVRTIAGLGFGVACLVPLALALSAPLDLVPAPLALACRSWPGWRWLWLCRPGSFVAPWSWLCRSWFCWPWLCWSWLRGGSKAHRQASRRQPSKRSNSLATTS